MHFTTRIKREVFLELILYAAGIVGIINFYKTNLFLTFIIILTWIVGLVLWHTSHDIIFFVIGAIAGPTAEIICIYYGVWQYSNPSFLGIPIWLPFAWGMAVILIKRISETFVKIELI
jgi:hypothetical protein